LLENGGHAGVPSVYRTLLEIYVELRNLSHCKTYGYCMDTAYFKYRLTFFKNVKKGNPYFVGMADGLDLEVEIPKCKEKIKELEDRGYRQLSVWNRFDHAGMADEYNSVYHILSGDAHANKSVLINRHFEHKDGDFNVVFFKDTSIDSMSHYIFLTVETLIESAVILHTELDSGKAEEIRQLHKGYNAILEELSSLSAS